MSANRILTLFPRLFIVCVFTAYCIRPAAAQEPAETAAEESKPTVAEAIMESSDGNVDIVIDPELLEEIIQPPHGAKRQRHSTAPAPGRNKMKGYRIQVFSDGRNQSSLESRAKARGSAIAAKFPKYRGQVYTYSSAPNWITRIGNFQTSGEANEALAELKRAFPSFAGEMRIVRTEVYVIR